MKPKHNISCFSQFHYVAVIYVLVPKALEVFSLFSEKRIVMNSENLLHTLSFLVLIRYRNEHLPFLPHKICCVFRLELVSV